ncbi:MAG: type II toxin-antitoxin system HicA family toxin [Bradyrhizobiaceae bacterium]|nr:type II toxin-antitoxin system HicA family toxin [Hyphomicrobiales bacterium]MBV9428029.1 type II toxin-antitoxin system HicA family toxin [Bradyrhizobiaceae bacterium]
MARAYDSLAESEAPANVSALERCGFTVIRTAGSHYQLFNGRTRRHTTVPYHNRDMPPAPLRRSFGRRGDTGRVPQRHLKAYCAFAS